MNPLLRSFLSCSTLARMHARTHTNEGGQLCWYRASRALRRPGTQSEKKAAACTVILLHAELRHFALTAWRGVTALCVDAPRVVGPRKASARPRWPPSRKSSLSLWLFKVIRVKAWGTPHKHSAIRIIYGPAGGVRKLQPAAMLLLHAWRVTCFCSWTISELQPHRLTPFTCTMTTPLLSLRHHHVAALLLTQGARPKAAQIPIFGHIHAKPHEHRLH